MSSGRGGCVLSSDGGGGPAVLAADGLLFAGETDRELTDAKVVDLEVSAGERIWLVTHHGHGYRPHNEDRIAVVESPTADGSVAAYFVIDGMGGHRDGDVSAQTLAEELVGAYRRPESAHRSLCRDLLVAMVVRALDQLPGDRVVAVAAEELFGRVLEHTEELEPWQLVDASIRAVQAASARVSAPSQGALRQMAKVIGALSRVEVPDRADIAVHASRARLTTFGRDESCPDACFIGGVVHTAQDGSKTLDVKQIGDCKLVLADREGRIRFQSVNESLMPEPDLRDPDLGLEQLMAYSLHRNVVASSLMSSESLKRYRRGDLPIRLAPGDQILIYSDGCDDLFSPEELLGLGLGRTPVEQFREVLAWAERRMRHVEALLRAAREGRSSSERLRAYPAVHQAMNEARLREGCYLEHYVDGTVGRWTKPPKCDNLALCLVRIGG